MKRKTKNDIDPLELKLELFLSKSWHIIQRESKRAVKWLFFYQPESKMEGNLHIFDVLVLVYLTIRLMSI